jgi:carboxypeptidase D
VQLPTHQDQGEEETIPLTRRGNGDEEEEVEDVRQRKGKERELPVAGSPIFNVGDSEDEEEYRIVNGN